VIYFFIVLIILDSSHNLSPMVMAWSRADVRAMMYRHWVRYIAFPAMLLVGSLAAALTAPPGAHYGESPVVDAIVNIYFVWNAWHFTAQNYGLVKLWGRGPDWPIYAAAMTLVGMTAIPALAIYAGYVWEWRLAGLALLAIPHWVSEIAITSWASARWKVFCPLILAAGCVGLLWVTPRATGMPVVGVWWVCWRSGLGFVHFLYDSQLWRFRDPDVRATIGKSLAWAR
jgi:hypothetical protein